MGQKKRIVREGKKRERDHIHQHHSPQSGRVEHCHSKQEEVVRLNGDKSLHPLSKREKDTPV